MSDQGHYEEVAGLMSSRNSPSQTQETTQTIISSTVLHYGMKNGYCIPYKWIIWRMKVKTGLAED